MEHDVISVRPLSHDSTKTIQKSDCSSISGSGRISERSTTSCTEVENGKRLTPVQNIERRLLVSSSQNQQRSRFSSSVSEYSLNSSNKKLSEPVSRSASDSLMSIAASSVKAKLESNKHRLSFGCVDLGKKMVQMATLRNCSKEILRLEVSLRHKTSAFQLIENSGGCRLLSPGESFSLIVMFCPTKVEDYSNKVMFSIASCQERFSIPISGQGGCALMKLDDFDIKADGAYQIWISGTQFRREFTVRNRGHRSGFFKIVASEFTDSMEFEPSKGVVKPGGVMKICVISREKDPVVNAIVFWGEEIQRRRLRSYEKKRGSDLIRIGGSTFTETFENEEPQKNDFPEILSSSDCRLFVGSLRNFPIRVLSQPNSFGYTTRLKSFAVLHPDETAIGNNTVSSPSALKSPFSNHRPSSSLWETNHRKRNDSPPEKGPPAAKKVPSKSMDNKENAGTISVNPSKVSFSVTKVNAWDSVKIELRNVFRTSNLIRLRIISGPFCVKITEYRMDPLKYVRIPVYFEPKATGKFQGSVEVVSELCDSIIVPLEGKAIS